MKNFIASMTFLFISNAFATTTYFVKYATSTVHPTTKLGKMAFQTLPAKADVGVLQVYTLDSERKETILKDEKIAQSPLLFKVQFVGNSAVNLIDVQNNVLVAAPAKIFTKPIFGTLIGGHFPNLTVVAPVIVNTAKEAVANTIGTNNFTMTLAYESSGGSCNEQSSKNVTCLISIYQIYKIEVE